MGGREGGSGMDKKGLKGPSFPPPFEPIVHNFPRLNIPSFFILRPLLLGAAAGLDRRTYDVCTEIWIFERKREGSYFFSPKFLLCRYPRTQSTEFPDP